jgi:nitrogen regulatory protein P-II 1
MKKIEAFVRPERLDDIRKVLVETGHRSMINYDIWYRGTEHESSQHQEHGSSRLNDFMPKVKIELMVKDEAVQDLVDTICNTACTGHVGDGKIFILPAETAIRIQTKETGDMVF